MTDWLDKLERDAKAEITDFVDVLADEMERLCRLVRAADALATRVEDYDSSDDQLDDAVAEYRKERDA